MLHLPDSGREATGVRFQFAFHQVQSAIMPLVGLKSINPQRGQKSPPHCEGTAEVAKPQIQSIENECVNRNPLLLAAHCSPYGLRALPHKPILRKLCGIRLKLALLTLAEKSAAIPQAMESYGTTNT